MFFPRCVLNYLSLDRRRHGDHRGTSSTCLVRAPWRHRRHVITSLVPKFRHERFVCGTFQCIYLASGTWQLGRLVLGVLGVVEVGLVHGYLLVHHPSRIDPREHQTCRLEGLVFDRGNIAPGFYLVQMSWLFGTITFLIAFDGFHLAAALTDWTSNPVIIAQCCVIILWWVVRRPLSRKYRCKQITLMLYIDGESVLEVSVWDRQLRPN